MKKLIFIVLGIFVLAAQTKSLTASPLDDKVAALKEAMKAEIADKASKANAAGIPASSGDFAYRSAGAVEVMLSNIPDMGSGEAQASLQQLLPMFSSDAVEKAGQDLLGEIHRERQAKMDAYIASVDEIIKSASPIVLKATKASDLDQLLVDLQKVQEQARENSVMDQALQRETQRAAAAYQFVAGWQDYLSEVANGKVEQAQNELRSLAQNNFGESMVPRSEILDRVNKLAPSAATGPGGAPESSSTLAKEIAEGIQSLDDMAPALQRIKALPPAQGDYDLSRISQTLDRFVTDYGNTKAGLPVVFNFGFPAFEPQFNNPKLYTKLWIFFLEHEFDAYKGPPAVEGESPLQFLDQVFADAEQREDWHELQQAYLAHAYLQRNSLFSTGTSPHDTTGFEFMLAGLNQETAGQYAAAVLSYEQALKFPDTYLPAKFIGGRLNNIEKDHLDEYTKGLQLSGLAPSSTASASPVAPAASPH